MALGYAVMRWSTPVLGNQLLPFAVLRRTMEATGHGLSPASLPEATSLPSARAAVTQRTELPTFPLSVGLERSLAKRTKRGSRVFYLYATAIQSR